jgi:hypothetical protein
MGLDWAGMTAGIVRELGDEVTLYPVRAASVGASEGTAINAVVERRAVLNDEGAAGVQNGDVTLVIDSDTAAGFELRSSSFLWEGRLFDIVRIEDEVGAVTCYTTEFL